MPSRKIAIDARLVGGSSTGDTSYWNGLLQGLMQCQSNNEYLLFTNKERPAGIPENPRFKWIELRSRSGRWWSNVRLPLAARSLGAKVIHTQYNLSPLAGKGGVTTVHDVSFFSNPEWFKPVERAMLQKLIPPSCRRAARIITVSEFSKREIERFIPGVSAKVRVTHNACGAGVLPVPKEEARAIVQSELGIEGPFILTVGTRWPRKNLQLAIDAVNLLPASVPHQLALTGRIWWGEEELSQRVAATGYVTQSQINALYSAADLYLAPSLYEGFGITLLEAFRCGCPVLASPSEAHKEVGADAPFYGRDWEPSTWSTQIQEVLSLSTEEKQAATARSLAREQSFTWAEMARLTEETYREIHDSL